MVCRCNDLGERKFDRSIWDLYLASTLAITGKKQKTKTETSLCLILFSGTQSGFELLIGPLRLDSDAFSLLFFFYNGTFLELLLY